MKFVTDRAFADPDAAARTLIEIANAVEPVQDVAFMSSASTRRSSQQAAAARNFAPVSSALLRSAGYGATRAGLI
jgi:hypothetical protein